MKKDKRRDYTKNEISTKAQQMALNLLKNGIGLGNKHKAPPGYISRLIDGIHKGRIKEG